jgi:3-hydroxyacyl-[acyl-carrier-protein] dehydratase
MWIDRVVELVPRERIVCIKHLSLAEEHLHDHFRAAHEVVPNAEGGWWQPASDEPNRSATLIDCGSALPLMPASLMIEGMAQTAGILVGHANDFKDKPVLAKISKAELTLDATAGQTIRYTAVAERLDPVGASVLGTVDIISVAADGSTSVQRSGEISLMFSNIDQNMSGLVFPEHNFVFSESFQTLLSLSGVEMPSGVSR